MTRTSRRLLVALLIAVATACGPRGPVDVPLATLAAEQEAYDGRTVVTEGVVVEVRDAGADPPYYVLQDDSDNRVRLTPAAVARPHLDDRVTVSGEFRFVPDRGRELQIERISPLYQGAQPLRRAGG